MIRTAIVPLRWGCYVVGYIGGRVFAALPGTGRVCDLIEARA